MLSEQIIELSAIAYGGKTLECNDEHYGSIQNLLKPGRGFDMSDGWETRRRREPGYDWVIIKLGHAGLLEKIEIDTAHFKGNFPHQISINAAYLPNDCDKNLAPRSLYWEELLGLHKLEMDKQHFFENEVNDMGPVSHVRVNIHPDGGLSRVRFYGRKYVP
jgi:allantoicase